MAGFIMSVILDI